MLRNYFKIAWRNLRKHRFYSAINILGLFTGIAFTLLISAYVWGELQVNNNLKNSNRQYILLSHWEKPDMGLDFTTLAPLAKRLKEEYPHLVANYYRFDGITSLVSKDNKRFRKYVHLSDASLLTMYGFKLLYGNNLTALTNPYSVIITKNVALSIFGKTDVVGETITLENFNGKKRNFSITGVFDALPKNSVIDLNSENAIKTDVMPEIFIPRSNRDFFNRGDLENWNNKYIPSFIELNKGVKPKDIQEPINNLIAQHAPENFKKYLNVNPVLLTDFYLEKDNARIKRMLYTLSIIGLFILLMAIINFINISLSMSGSRIKEIGMRKVLGGERKQLIFQFLIESFVLVLFATVIALGAYVVMRPMCVELLNAEIPTLNMFSHVAVFIIIGFVGVISLLAGFYPAFILSSLKTIQVLKGKLQIKNTTQQKSLVGFQFAISLLILICAFVITKQVNYFFEKDLGYSKDYILTVQTPRDWSEKGVNRMESIRHEFESMPQINKASVSYEIPNGNFGGSFSMQRVGAPENNAVPIKSLVVDHHFFSTYEIAVKEHLKLSPENNLVLSINESAAKKFGWENPTDAIGKRIKIREEVYEYMIQNVVSDFHFDTMNKKIGPLVFFNLKTVPRYRYLSLKVQQGNLEVAVANIREKWNTLLPDAIFDYQFMDDTLHNLYASEIRFKKTVYYASLLSLIIILLGIVGLVSLSAHKRVKEIGVRKVLGASKISIIVLFLKEFSGTIIIASVIAIPLAFYFTKQWLNNFEYKVDISPQPFIMSTFILFFITILLIAVLILKTLMAKPVNALRSE